MRLKRQVELIERYAREFLEYRRRGESVYAVERLAQLLIQSLLDLGAMIAVYTGKLKPETYKGVGRFLATIVGEEHRKFLEEMAGFRNVLVHGYAAIDRTLEEEGFKELENKIFLVIEEVKKYIERASIDPPAEFEELNKVFERYNVRYAVLFGSRAREGKGRDYDIAVSGEFRSALELGGLLVDVAEALGVHEDLVDLVHIESAPLTLIYTIISEGVVIYGDPDEALWDLTKRYLEYLDMNETWAIVERLGGAGA